VVSAGLAVLGAVTVAQGSGLGPAVLPDIFIRPLLGAFVALFALSFLGNAASKSRIERLHGVSLTIVLAGSCVILGSARLSGRLQQRQHRRITRFPRLREDLGRVFVGHLVEQLVLRPREEPRTAEARWPDHHVAGQKRLKHVALAHQKGPHHR
jgi:hypothetical protein